MALKIVYKICCGIDVHKNFVVACIAKTDKQGITIYESHHFSTYTKGLKALLKWPLDRNCKDVCMESTGKYWIPVYNVLEKDCSIVLAHPKYVKAIRGKKPTRKMRNGLLTCLSMILFLCSAQTPQSRANSILKFGTAISVSKSVAVIRKQSLLLQGCFLPHCTTCSKMEKTIIQIYIKNLMFFLQLVRSPLSRPF